MGRKPIEKVCCVCLIKGLDFNKLTQKDDKKISLLTKFRMCIVEVQWHSSFYLCLDCTKTLDVVHKFRDRCIQSDLIRRGQQQLEAKQEVKECAENSNNDNLTEEECIKEEIKEDIDDEDSKEDNFIPLESFFTTVNHSISRSTEDQHDKSENENEPEDTDRMVDRKQLGHTDRKTSDGRKIRRKRRRKFPCDRCSKSFLASTKLVAHCVNDHGMKHKDIKPFFCDRCPQKFSTSSTFWQHMKYHEGVKSSVCSYCGKGFITKNDLMNHEKKHLNMREYKCESCGKSFNTSKDVRSHRLIVHTDSSLWKYVCEICTKPFPIKSNYDSHMRRHMGDKKFGCHLCDKKFTTKCDLQRHTRSHSDIREHQCRYCEKEYKDERLLKVHLAKVHGIGLGNVKIPVRERKYACHFCSKAYFAKNKLTRHLYTHSGEKPFSCPICEKKFNDKSYVKQHLRNSHNIESHEAVERPSKMSYLQINTQ